MIDIAFEYSEEILKTLINSYFSMIIDFARNGLLDLYVLSEMEEMTRGLIFNLDKNPLYKSSFCIIMDLYNEVRKIAENEINDNQIVYTELYKQMSSFKSLMEKENKKDKKIIEKLDNIISTFTSIEKIQDELKNNVITIKWHQFEN